MIVIVVDLRAQMKAIEIHTNRLRRDEDLGLRAEMDIWPEHVDILGYSPALGPQPRVSRMMKSQVNRTHITMTAKSRLTKTILLVS
jgi:hypothetical protein